MAIANEQTIAAGVGDSGGDISLASWSPATDELVLVGLSTRDTSQSPSVSGNGYTWVEVANVLNTQSQFKMWLYRAMKTSPSTGAITITLSGNADPAGAIATRFSGVDTGGTNGSSAVEASATDVGPDPDDTDMLSSITTVTNDAWAFAVGSHRNSTFTVPGGETALSINNLYGTGGGIVTISSWYQSVASAGSTQLGATSDLSSARDWAMILTSIKPASAAVADLLGADYQLNTFGALTL